MLRRNAFGWEFESELALENFVYANLESIFGLTPLKRQYNCNDEFCDILAIDKHDRLVIIELKNAVDRYIVQQLTRYYDSLLKEKPFSAQINYDLPVRLIAVTPNFHRHNLIDRTYNKLEFEFLHFQVVYSDERFYLLLENIDTSETFQGEIPYQKVEIVDIDNNIPAPPQSLLDYLGFYTLDQQQQILKLRNKIISFDQRMQEIITSKSIQYGRPQSKLCAEIYFHRKESQLVLFMWIPLWNYRNKVSIGRHRIWSDWSQVSYIAHVLEGLGKQKSSQEWISVPYEKRPRNYYHRKYSANEFHENIANFIGCKDKSCSLESVVDVALSRWLERL